MNGAATRLAFGLAALCMLAAPAGRAAAPALPKTLSLTMVEGIPSLTQGVARLLVEAYACLGIKADVRALPNLRALAAGHEGQSDGEVARFLPYEKAAPDMLRVPTPVLDHVDYAPFVLHGQQHDLSSLDKIAQSRLRVGVRLGAQFIEGTAMAGQVAASPTSYDAVFLMLLSGRLDVVLAPVNMWQEVRAQMPPQFDDAGKRVVQLAPVLTMPAYHYLHPRWAPLVPVIDAQLQRMKQNGSTERLLRQDGKPRC